MLNMREEIKTKLYRLGACAFTAFSGYSLAITIDAVQAGNYKNAGWCGAGTLLYFLMGFSYSENVGKREVELMQNHERLARMLDTKLP